MAADETKTEAFGHTAFSDLTWYGMAIQCQTMVRTTVKSTYAFDLETMHKLDALAAQWQVSKSEALRRAIDLAVRDQAVGASPRLQAFQKLQKSLNARLTKRQIERWETEMRRERVRSSARREWRKA